MKQRFVVIALIVLTTLAAGAVAYYLQSDRIVARVESYAITRNDITLRNAVNKIFYPQVEQQYGEEQIIKAYSAAQIMANHGRAVTDKMIRAEEIRIDRSTRDAEMLEKIKAVFDGDLDAYRRVFILPNLMDKVFQQFYESNDRFHAGSLDEAKRLLQLARQSNGSLVEIARREKLPHHMMRISQSEGVYLWSATADQDRRASVPNDVPPHVRDMVEQKGPRGDVRLAPLWLSELTPLKKNDFLPTPLEQEDAWLIARVVDVAKVKVGKSAESRYTIEVIRFPKLNFEKWFETEKRKLNVSIK